MKLVFDVVDVVVDCDKDTDDDDDWKRLVIQNENGGKDDAQIQRGPQSGHRILPKPTKVPCSPTRCVR